MSSSHSQQGPFLRAVVFAAFLTLTVVVAAPHKRQTQSHVLSSLASVRNLRQVSRQFSEDQCTLDCDGFTFSPCNRDDECVSPLSCYNDDLTGPCDGDFCVCYGGTVKLCDACISCAYPNETCTSNRDGTYSCLDSCYVRDQHLPAFAGCNLNPSQSACPSISEAATPTPTPSTTPVNATSSATPTTKSPTPSPFPKKASTKCIAASAMAHLPISQRVFRTHHVAAVRCDIHDNCATKGHMVVFDGRAMTMDRYCRMVQGGCVHKSVPVNSPKYRPGLRLSSNSPRLQFTAFAATFESRAEEFALAVAIHVGM